MVHLSLRTMPFAVVEAIYHVIDALGLNIDGQAIVYDTTSGVIQLEGQTPRRSSADVVQPVRKYSVYQLPDEVTRFLIRRCSEHGVTFAV